MKRTMITAADDAPAKPWQGWSTSANLKTLAQIAPGISARSLRGVVSSVFSLGVGQAVSTLSSLLLFAYLSRHFGVELLGIVALAQTVALYVTLGTDQGLRLIGARLVARHGSAASVIIREILVKRLLSCAVCITLGCAYALYGPVPHSARPYILGFVLAVIPYAFSLDWLAWGLNKFAWLGGFNGGVKVVFLVGSLIGIILTGKTLSPIILANGFAAILGALALWTVWRQRWKEEVASSPVAEVLIQKELRWLAILPLGMANLLNQAFHNLDTVLLGAMSTAAEVGRYTSAYKILFLILGAYWLVISSLYPKLSRAKGGPHARRLLFRTLLLVAAAGAALTVGIGVFAPVILRVVYGSNLGAIGLLRVLVFAIPMDFCVALLSTVLVSRGYDRVILASAGSAAALNIILNLFLIPRFQALGAAIATLASYGYLLAFLLQQTITKPVFADTGAPSNAF